MDVRIGREMLPSVLNAGFTIHSCCAIMWKKIIPFNTPLPYMVIFMRNLRENYKKNSTRMHSSRIRTDRRLTISWRIRGGGVHPGCTPGCTPLLDRQTPVKM